MKQPLIDNLVVPILIETPFAVGPVYSYLIRDEKTVLVDCGQYSDSAYEQLRMGLQDNALEITDIDEIWLTHGHPDHYGQAARLADESGAIVKGHRKERANFAANKDRVLFRDFFTRHALPGQMIEKMLEQLDWLQQYQQAIEPDWISEDDQLSSGRLEFSVKHTPGHAPGHVVFYSEPGLYFGGDVLLEHISTNALINFDPDSGARSKSLLQYRESLQWMKKQEGLVLPGHGKKINEIAKIADHHINEQDERYAKIRQLLKNQPQTLLELGEQLFPEALQRGEYFLVLSEIVGYLDWGEKEEKINQRLENRGLVYEPS